MKRLIKELECSSGSKVTGNLRSLRVLKDTLQTFTLCNCPEVEGNFMALADFPQLRTLRLFNTAVTVDIGDLLNGDKVKATFKDGLLSIEIPKIEPEKPKKHSVKIS